MFVHFAQELRLSPLVVRLVEQTHFVLAFILINESELFDFVHVVVRGRDS